MYQMTRLKFWLILFGVLMLGSFFGSANSTREITKEVPVEKIVIKEVAKEVSAQCDYSDWKILKGIDDEGFNLATQTVNLCSQGFYAVSKSDVNTLLDISDKMKLVTPRITEVASKRQAVLKKLGY